MKFTFLLGVTLCMVYTAIRILQWITDGRPML